MERAEYNVTLDRNSIGRRTATLTHSNGNRDLILTLGSGGGNARLTWTGAAGDSLWNLTSENWTGGDTRFDNGDAVTFNLAAGGDITVVGNVTVADMLVSGDGDWTFSGGNIVGNTTATTLTGVAGSLTRAGTGTLTLLNDNNFSGGTVVTSGTLQIGNGGTTGSITFNFGI